MRYITTDNIVFTDKDGGVFTLKDMREYPDYTMMMSINLQSGDMLDEIVGRKSVYGDDSEMEVYKLFDFNKLAIVEADFDLSKLKKIGIPV